MINKNKVSFLRAQVNHYSFLTGLTGKLEGKSGGPEDSSVHLNVLLNADITEGKRVVKPDIFPLLEDAPYHNVLQGSLGQCCDLLSFIAGTYDSQQLQDLRYSNPASIPTQFTLEEWETEDQTIWQHKRNIVWDGVNWLDAAHTGDGGDRMCAGVATFTCSSKTVEEVSDGEKVEVPAARVKYARFELRKILLEKMDGPKHPASYMG